MRRPSKLLAEWGETVPCTRSRASPDVTAYIARCPPGTRSKLREVRRLIRHGAPDATERVSYRMPGLAYPGYPYRGMFVWFGLQRGYIGLYLRPPTIARHRRELAGYTTTKSALHLPLDRPIPSRLVLKLVRASLEVMKQGRR